MVLPSGDLEFHFLLQWACMPVPQKAEGETISKGRSEGMRNLDAPSNFDLILIHLYVPIRTKVGLALECETHILQSKITNRSLVDVMFHDDNGSGSFNPW